MSKRSAPAGPAAFDDNTLTFSLRMGRRPRAAAFLIDVSAHSLGRDMRTTPSRVLLALILASGLAGTAVCSAADAPAPAASQPANAVRPEFATPLNAAQQLIKDGKGPEALVKLKEVAAVPNPSPFEQYLLLRVRGQAEYAALDKASAATDFEAALASPQLPLEDRKPLSRVLIQLYYETSQYDKAIAWIDKYQAANGKDATLDEMLAQCQYLNKDYPSAAKSYATLIDAEYAAGKVPTEKRLRVLHSAQALSNDTAGDQKTIERLAVSYPKDEYWQSLVSHAAHVEKLSDRQYLEVYRLKAAINGQVSNDDRLSFAALAARAGYPSEAKRLLDDGIAKKAFAGPELGEAQKLLPSVTRAAAQDKAQGAANETAARSSKDGNAAASLGMLDTIDGNAQQGAALISLGLEKGGLKFPDEARLHLGIAQYGAGQLPEAQKSFQAATNASGIGQIAHVWALFVQSKLQPAAAPATAAAASK